MDAKGLHKFISDNRKNLASIKEEIPIALKSASNPGFLVLDSLTGFYIPEISNSDSKKDSNLLGIRRTCIMLMECLSILLTNLDETTTCEVISEDVKNRAKIIAQEWKPKLDNLDLDDSNGNSLEAHVFLQLIATFGINSDFVNEDLVKLIPMVSRRHQTADLCRFLGLSDKMPGVIDVLVNNGRHIDAVNLAFEFELTQQFSPITLLKSYLAEAVKVPSTPTAQSDVSERELSALKAITKCIEEHKLENGYPIDPLQKRILQLEKVKSDKKQATEVVKPQSKRPEPMVLYQDTGPAIQGMHHHHRHQLNTYMITEPHCMLTMHHHPKRMFTRFSVRLLTVWLLIMGPILGMGISIKLRIFIKCVNMIQQKNDESWFYINL